MTKDTDTRFIQPLGQVADRNKVGATLYGLATRDMVQEQFRKRHQLGMLARYGKTVEHSLRILNSDTDLHRSEQLGTFILNGYDGQTIGMATVDPAARVRRQRLQIAPFLAKGFLSYAIATHGPKVTAWVAPGTGKEGGEVLSAAYRVLADPNGPARQYFDTYVELEDLDIAPTPQAWTLEPQQAPDWTKQSIRAAGYERVDIAYFNDHTSSTSVPPISGLYVARVQ